MLSLSSEHALRSLVAAGVGLVALAVAALFLAEVARALAAARGRVPTGLARVVRRSPRLVRGAAELAVAALLALGPARPATASSTPIRDWLSRSPSTTPASTTTTTGTPTTASAAPLGDGTGPAPTTTTRPATAPTTNPVPVEPTPPHAPPAPTSPATTTPGAPQGASYVVEPGDCLWRIAARVLGPGAPNVAVDAGWRAIYAANRASIGDDPGLIHPGLVLALPPLPVAR